MSILLLSLLFVLILFAAVVMQPRYYSNSIEGFHDPNSIQKVMMSPSLSQILTTPSMVPDVPKPKIDALSRDAVVQYATSSGLDQSYDLLAVPHNAKGNLLYSPDDNTIELASKKGKKRKSKSKSRNQSKDNGQCDKPINCPKCQECPDMSQYVRLDEVPCWNCTLP